MTFNKPTTNRKALDEFETIHYKSTALGLVTNVPLAASPARYSPVTAAVATPAVERAGAGAKTAHLNAHAVAAAAVDRAHHHYT